MVLENKSAKYICIIGGLIMILLFLSGFVKSLDATYITGTVTKIYEIEEYLVLNNNTRNGDSSDDYDYKAYIDVKADGQNYKILIYRETKYTFPKEGENIELSIHSDGTICEAQKIRTYSSGVVLLLFGIVLLIGGLTGKVKDK